MKALIVFLITFPLSVLALIFSIKRKINELNKNKMKALEEINIQIEEQVNVLKKLRAEKDKIIEELSKNYVGKYIKLSNNKEFYIMKIKKVALDEVDTPYKYYGDIFKFSDGDHRYLEDSILFDDDFDTIESLIKEKYDELVKQFINKMIVK